MNILAGGAFTTNNMSSYLLPEKPLYMLLVCLLGTRSILKTYLSIGLVITAAIVRAITLLTKHRLPEFHHIVYGKSSYDGDDNTVTSSNRYILCRAIAIRSVLCLALLLFGSQFVTTLDSTPHFITAVIFGALAWTSLTFNIFDFDETLCGGNMDSIDHVDIVGREGVLTRQPADSEIVFRKYKYTIPIGEFDVITDGEMLKSKACESLDDLLGRNCTQLRYLGRQGEFIHRFYCHDEEQEIHITEDKIARLAAKSKELKIINLHATFRVPIIPEEVQNILNVLHFIGQHDGILTASCKHDIIHKLMNNDEMCELQTPVLSTGKWFSCKAWFFEALLDGVDETTAATGGVERPPMPFAGYLFGKSFLISTILVVVALIAVVTSGPVVATTNVSLSSLISLDYSTVAFDYLVVWLSVWCVCLFIGPHSLCLYYDDNCRHTTAICSQLGISSIHVTNQSGHLTIRDVIFLQIHHCSLFLSITIFAILLSKNT